MMHVPINIRFQAAIYEVAGVTVNNDYTIGKTSMTWWEASKIHNMAKTYNIITARYHATICQKKNRGKVQEK